jgi:LysM repeat protein
VDPVTPGKEFFYKRLLRRSLWALGISGICNVFAFSYIAIELEEGGFYAPSVQQKEPVLPFDAPTSQSLHQDFVAVRELSFDTLIGLLDDKTPVSDGYKKQDIALSALVTLHHIHLERAVGTMAIQKRIVKVDGKNFRLTPGLTHEEFSLISSFIAKEEWPFTFEGLHAKLQAEPELFSLKMACIQTRQYQYLLAALIQDAKISQDQAHQLILASDFATLTQFAQLTEKQAGKVDHAIRRGFLVKLLPNHPQLIVPLLVTMDMDYAVHSLDDTLTILILQNLQEHPKLRQEYALGLLVSPRSDAVWNEAVVHLCELTKLDSEKENRSTLLNRFGIVKTKASKKVDPVVAKKEVENTVAAKKPAPVIKKPDLIAAKPQLQGAAKPKTAATAKTTIKPHSTTAKPQTVKKPQKALAEIVHVVKSGDNLWALSRRYKVDVQTIKRRNNLHSDALKPGTELRIPITTQK